MHLPFKIVPYGAFFAQSWLVHHLHGEFNDVIKPFEVILPHRVSILCRFLHLGRLSRLRSALLFPLLLKQLLELRLAKPDDSLDPAETASANVVADQEFVDKFVAAFQPKFDFIGEVHGGLEEVLVRYELGSVRPNLDCV